MSEKDELLSLRYEELESLITAMGEGKFRAKQVFEWLKRGADFDEMIQQYGGDLYLFNTDNGY